MRWVRLSVFAMGAATLVCVELTAGCGALLGFQALPSAPADGGASAGDATAADAESGGIDAGDACPSLATANDFYVNHAAGTGACSTFPTIVAAVEAAQASSASLRTIHLANGTYSVDTGESFPIELRGGISVVGAGPGESVVTGTGSVDVSLPVNEFGSLTLAESLAATFLVGDTVATTTISNLSIEAVPGNNAGLEGIVCDRGNAASPPPAPNTIVDGVTIAGFEAGIRVTWSNGPGVLSGCNAVVRSSTLRDGAFGVVADGRLGSGGSPTQWVSVQLGGSATDGNTLLNFDYSNDQIVHNGSGLAIADAVTGSVVRGNTFAAEVGAIGAFGVWAMQTTYDAIGLDIEDNIFGPLASGGLSLGGNVAVARLVGNTFQGITMEGLNPNCCDWDGAGVAVGAWGVDGTPFIAYARNNAFIGNDIGVIFRSNESPLPADPSTLSDFGTASSPGGNSFHCNSTPPGDTANLRGADVIVDIELMQPPNVVLPFVGNVWDQVPPTTVITGSRWGFANGTDVYEYGDDAGADGAPQLLGAGIDVSNASTVPYTCPSGRIAEP